MEVHSGTTRIAICFPKLGFVLKFPHKNPIKGFIGHLRIFNRIKVYNKKRAEAGIKTLDTFKWRAKYLWVDTKWAYYYSGFRANLFECCVYWTTFSPFLEPTYFSFFGLCNIQRYAKPLDMDSNHHWEQLYDIIERDIYSNGHHFGDPKNFSYDGTCIRMLDYGSHGIRDVVKKYGKQLAKELDPLFVPDESQ